MTEEEKRAVSTALAITAAVAGFIGALCTILVTL